MIAEDIKIESEEDGFHLVVDGERWLIADPEALYDHVKAVIGPWLYERDQARRTFRPRVFLCVPDESGGLDERWHSVHADIYDNREGK